MQSVPLFDCAGRGRSPATLASFHQGLAPRNKGLRYPPDAPTVEEIIAVINAASGGPDGLRLHGVIVVLWRVGLRVSEALALSETDLDPDRGALLVRRGEGGKRREVGMDRWGWTLLGPWLELRTRLPVGALFCVLRGPTRGRPCAPAGVRGQLHRAAQRAGVRRRFAPHSCDMRTPSRCPVKACPCWSSNVGHADLGITSAYLRGIDNTEIIHAVHERPAPMIPASTQLASQR